MPSVCIKEWKQFSAMKISSLAAIKWHLDDNISSTNSVQTGVDQFQHFVI